MKTLRFASMVLVFASFCAQTLQAEDVAYFWKKTTPDEETVNFWPSQPSGEGITYSGSPFTLSYGSDNGHFINLAGSTGVPFSGSWNQHAMTEIEDCNARVSCLNKSFRVDIDSGTYNWYDPFGETWKTLPYIEWMRCAGCWTTCDTVGMYIHGGETRWPSIWVRGWSQKDAYFSFDGGTHLLGGDVRFPYDSQAGSVSCHFEVTDTAKVVLGAVFRMGWGSSADQDLYFKVANGGELKIEGSKAYFEQTGMGRHHINVENATLSFGTFDTSTGYPLFTVGPQSAAAAANIESTFYMTKSIVRDGTIEFYGGDNLIEDSEMPGTKINIGKASDLDAEVSIRDVKIGDTCTVGVGGSATLTVAGTENAVTNLVVGGNEGATWVEADTKVLFTEGGALTCKSLQLGGRYGMTGVIEVPSGSSLTVDGTFCIGKGGVGELLISGGDFRAQYGYMAQRSTSAEPQAGVTNVFRMTGGTATLTYKSSDESGFNVCDNPYGRPCMVILDGGTLTARSTRGWRGTPSYNFGGATGWAAFEANGGTIVAPCATTRLLDTFETAALGAKGLTIRSDYNVTVAQGFQDQPDAAGKLVLEGSGVKTLTGDSSGLSETVVREGAAVLTGARMGGLTLDGGILNLSSAQPVSVAGDLVAVKAKFALDAGFTLGTTRTIFSVGGEISDASKAALAESMIVSGLAAGLAFDIDYDTESDPGKTLVMLTVREAKTVVIEATEGSVVDSDDHSVSAVDTLQAMAASGATLTLKGKLGRGNFEKTGAGVVMLKNEANRFLGSLYLYEGKLSVSSMLALGYDASGMGVFCLKGGTLELADTEGPAEFPYDLNVSPAEANAAVVIKTDEDTVFRKVTPVRGAIFKRGRGTLSFASETAMNLVTGNGTSAYGGDPARPETGIVFDNQGTPPDTTRWYGGLNVIEGVLEIRGTGTEPTKVALTENVTVGLPVVTRSEGASDPVLVIDNADVTMNRTYRPSIYVGGGISANGGNTVFPSSTVILTNHSSVAMHHWFVNRKTDNAAQQHAEIRLDSSCVTLKDKLFANMSARGGSTATYTLRNGSAIYAEAGIDCNGQDLGGGYNGPATFVVDASVLAANAAGDPFAFKAGNEASVLSFSNGSRFCCKSVHNGTTDAGGANVFTFDDSEWYPGSNDFSFGSNVGAVSKYYSVGRGLVLAPPAGVTYTWARKLEGEGGLVKRGEGALVMPMSNLAATGEVAVEAGTLDLDGTTATGRTFSGSGAIRNGALESPVIKVAKDAAGLDLGTIAPTGRVRVDFSEYGDEVPLKTAIPVARVSESVDLSNWRGKNIGITGVKATFAVQNGVVLATVDYAGLLMLVR